MDDNRDNRVVQMAVVNPGTEDATSEFVFSMQPRWNPARTVQYGLTAQDALSLKTALDAYLATKR